METEEHLKTLGRDEVFNLFHSILWRLNERKAEESFFSIMMPKGELVITDKAIRQAIDDLFKDYQSSPK